MKGCTQGNVSVRLPFQRSVCGGLHIGKDNRLTVPFRGECEEGCSQGKISVRLSLQEENEWRVAHQGKISVKLSLSEESVWRIAHREKLVSVWRIAHGERLAPGCPFKRRLYVWLHTKKGLRQTIPLRGECVEDCTQEKVSV
jgi:hypothetical protein